MHPPATPRTPAILYTRTDEAPALATRSLLPILQTFARRAGIAIEPRDISLAARILARCPDALEPSRRVPDALAELAQATLRPDANIIKLPNISASVPQLKAAIAELQRAGFPVPDYPENPGTPAAHDTRARYDKIKGSAVNPVLREGNSDRRAPASVKAYARKHPHAMGAWSPDSRTAVATMTSGDFYHNERTVTLSAPATARIVLQTADGRRVTLREKLPLQAGEILDATLLQKQPLLDFIQAQLDTAKARNLLLSVHLKATMMKVSDPVIFGHVVRVFLKKLIAANAPALERAGVNFNNGIGDLLAKLPLLAPAEQAAVRRDLDAARAENPELAMVNSDKGITNLHVPSDVIIDASMPAMIRNSGRMWDKNGALRDTLALIPDSTYAGVYQTVIEFCKRHGALDPKTLGTSPNVGLMAQAAEEYGSHDKTFVIPEDGVVSILDENNNALLRHTVSTGDIWRACQTKDAPVRDWIRLAVKRARATRTPAIFWLDANRPHDAALIAKINRYLPLENTEGLDIRILPPADACLLTLQRLVKGQDTISVTGNVLRDYLTDLFPIIEVGTSAKMLSIVPLLNGGGLFETGAGGSAPKHVRQFLEENYLRWDSLGEYLALAASLAHLAETQNNPKAAVLARTLDAANTRILENDKTPARKLGSLDNRGSHYYLALYWAEALAAQTDAPDLAAAFAPLARQLAANETRIIAELQAVQGSPVDIGGYYYPDDAKADAAMRPSPTLNALIDGF
ncbi:MAG: NADP-dependent isocitrate dehydrogenase [Opitutaceae bacterium]|jgi:isocitrate dehydrogenase|nr:NADP-dependent isocitrate dehydrogenase [Opitutaceae bacterium]